MYCFGVFLISYFEVIFLLIADTPVFKFDNDNMIYNFLVNYFIFWYKSQKQRRGTCGQKTGTDFNNGSAFRHMKNRYNDLKRDEIESLVSLQIVAGVPYQGEVFTSYPVLIELPYSVNWDSLFEAIEKTYEKLWEDSLIELEYLSWVRQYLPKVLAKIKLQSCPGGVLKTFCESVDVKSIHIPGNTEYILPGLCKVDYSGLAKLIPDLYKWAVEILASEDIKNALDDMVQLIFYDRLHSRIHNPNNEHNINTITQYEKEIYKVKANSTS